LRDVKDNELGGSRLQPTYGTS